jgi:hypothetical protein
VGLEVPQEILRLVETADGHRALFRPDVRDPVSEEFTHMVLVAPEWRRLGSGRWRRREGLHRGEHLSDEPFRRPAQQADAAPGLAYAQDLICAGLMVRREHHTQAGHHYIEFVVPEGQGLGVSFHPFELDATVGCLVPPGVEQFRRQVAGNHPCTHHGCGNGCIAGSGSDVQDPLLGFDSACIHQDRSEVQDQFAGQCGVVARGPHGPVLLLQRPVGLFDVRCIVHVGVPLL